MRIWNRDENLRDRVANKIQKDWLETLSLLYNTGYLKTKNPDHQKAVATINAAIQALSQDLTKEDYNG